MASDQQPLIIGLTFSQAQGLEPLPQPLALGEVSAHFRVDIWNWLYRQIAAHSYAGSSLTEPWDGIFLAIHLDLNHLALDDYNENSQFLTGLYKHNVMSFLPFNQLFDLIQFILRETYQLIIGEQYFDEMRAIFRRNLLAYDVLDIPPDGPTIVPNATPEEGEAVRQAFDALAASPFDGVAFICEMQLKASIGEMRRMRSVRL